MTFSSLGKNTCNTRNVHLFVNQNPRTKRYDLVCIAYRASQIGKLSHWNKRFNFAKNFQS